MNKRALPIGLALLVCVGFLSSALVQRSELGTLRAEQTRLLEESSATAESDRSPTPAPGIPESSSVSPELLKLRAEVTRLSQRRDELTSASALNPRERARTGVHQADSALPPGYIGADQGEIKVTDMSNITLPPGFIRASQARHAGFNSPEDTLETMLWAIHSRDFTNLLQVFTPEAAEQLQADAKRMGGVEGFFKSAGAIPGVSVASREQLPDGSVNVKAEIVPGVPFEMLHFLQINGQWKMEMQGMKR